MTPAYWQRSGTAIFTQEDKPRMVANLPGASTSAIDDLVMAHNLTMDRLTQLEPDGGQSEIND